MPDVPLDHLRDPVGAVGGGGRSADQGVAPVRSHHGDGARWCSTSTARCTRSTRRTSRRPQPTTRAATGSIPSTASRMPRGDPRCAAAARHVGPTTSRSRRPAGCRHRRAAAGDRRRPWIRRRAGLVRRPFQFAPTPPAAPARVARRVPQRGFAVIHAIDRPVGTRRSRWPSTVRSREVHPCPPLAARVGTDGYEVVLDRRLTSGTESPLGFTVTRNGTPVRDLQPHLGAGPDIALSVDGPHPRP